VVGFPAASIFSRSKESRGDDLEFLIFMVDKSLTCVSI
jgi:hypothetical protein